MAGRVGKSEETLEKRGGISEGCRDESHRNAKRHGANLWTLSYQSAEDRANYLPCRRKGGRGDCLAGLSERLRKRCPTHRLQRSDSCRSARCVLLFVALLGEHQSIGMESELESLHRDRQVPRGDRWLATVARWMGSQAKRIRKPSWPASPQPSR